MQRNSYRLAFDSLTPLICSSVALLCCSYTEKALDRGEQLDSIEQKSDVLLEDANKFQHSAAATKRMFCRRHWRNVLIIAVLASVRINGDTNGEGQCGKRTVVRRLASRWTHVLFPHRCCVCLCSCCQLLLALVIWWASS